MDTQLGLNLGASSTDLTGVIYEALVGMGFKPDTATDNDAEKWVTRGGCYKNWWRALPDDERAWWLNAHKEALGYVAMGQPMPRPERWEQQRWSNRATAQYARTIHRNQALRWAMEIGQGYDKGTKVMIEVPRDRAWVLRWAVGMARVPEIFITDNLKIEWLKEIGL